MSSNLMSSPSTKAKMTFADERATDDEFPRLKIEAQELKEKIEEARTAVRDTTLAEAMSTVTQGAMIKLRKRKTIRGHFGKVVGLHWGPEEHSRFACASQSCQLIVWNPIKSRKEKIFKLSTSFVMCCAYALSGDFIACGGLDNRCSIYDLRKEPKYQSAPVAEVTGHDAFVSFTRFLDDTRLLTASGDETCALWDVEFSTKNPHARFEGHTGSVSSLAISPTDPNMFVSGACDLSAKVWDIRQSYCAQTFTGPQQDVNSVKYLPSGQSFVIGSEDGTCRLYDIRCDQELQMYGAPIDPLDLRRQHFGVTAVDVSLSGRLIFAGFQSGHYMIWDTLKGIDRSTVKAHEGQLSTLGVSPDGMALATGSWDNTLRIWN